MRVLYIERSLDTQSVVYDQIRRIQKHASTHTIAVQESRVCPINDNQVTNVHCPFFPKIEVIKSWLFIQSTLSGWHKVDSQTHFDLIHAHFAYPDGLAAKKLSQRTGIPYVVTARGDDILIYPHRSAYLYQTINQTLKSSNGLVGVSQHICDEAIRLGAKSEQCRFIPDGIPESIFVWLPEQEKNRSINTILFAGALLPVKNVERLIDVFALLSKQFTDLVFLLAGDGPLKPVMEKKIGAHGIAKQCRFLGQLPPDQLAETMHQSSLLVLPSISEGWPNVVMEAMACGTPVVGARVGGIPEQIIDDSYGFLCDPYSPDDIADKIMTALSRTWDHQHIAQHGKTYTREKSAHQIYLFYQDILKNIRH